MSESFSEENKNEHLDITYEVFTCQNQTVHSTSSFLFLSGQLMSHQYSAELLINRQRQAWKMKQSKKQVLNRLQCILYKIDTIHVAWCSYAFETSGIVIFFQDTISILI